MTKQQSRIEDKQQPQKRLKTKPPIIQPARSQNEPAAAQEELSTELIRATQSEGEANQAAYLNDSRLQTAQRQILATQLGQLQGNHYLQRVLSLPDQPVAQQRVRQSMPANQIARLVPYNDVETGARFTDPEQASGVLPFTEEGWDGLAIGRRLTQLSPAAPRDDNQRCVQTSFLVALVQRGPGALREMIENYLSRYRVGLRQASTPPRIRRWYERSIRNLTPLLDKIDNKTLTYEDLSTILTEMYDVYGDFEGGTSLVAEMSMLRREGYQATALNKKDVTQEEAAAEAKALRNGEFLSCGVDASREGTGEVGHAVHIGRHPTTGTLYFYDPWPVTGNQLIECSEDLAEIEHYFLNPMEEEEEEVEIIEEEEEEEEEEEGGEAEDEDIEIFENRTFSIDAKYSPPAEEEAEETE